MGVTLPLWLRPPDLELRPAGVLEFLLATVLTHAGFSFLHARFEHRGHPRWTESRLSFAGVACLALVGLLGWHLLRLVPDRIFVVYGLAVLFAGLLYVAPPVRFSRRPGGEIVLSMSLGLLPVLGGYLVQTGDLTRPVYLAALPIYAAMLLRVWVEQMTVPGGEGNAAGDSLVTAFGRRVSGRVIVPLLSVLVCTTLIAAVLSAAVMPVALIALIFVVPMARIVTRSWCSFDDPSEMVRARNGAIVVHAGLCAVLVASSIWAAAG
ncbi:hypothetical protein GF314_13020 [bacterium]|nr:hypothetical protein [bacterium]